MGLSSVPPVCHPSATGLSWLFPLAPQRAGHILGSLGQPQRRFRLGWDLQGLRGWTGTAPRAWPCPDPTPEPGEAGGDGGSPGWAVGQEQSWTAAGPTPLLPTQGQVLLTASTEVPPPGPSWGTSEPCHHCHPGETGLQGKAGTCPRAPHPNPCAGSSGGTRRGPPPPATDLWGDFNKGLSLAGVPGAIPGGGIPGAGFFPGKGALAPLGGGITLFARMGRCLGGP